MTLKKYLEDVLESQALGEESEEVKQIQQHRKDVESLLRRAFADSSPTILYGGSRAKGTMIKDSYDLDIICYFLHDGDLPGKNLQEVYENVATALSSKYHIDRKKSAIRLKSKDDETYLADFHVDVVPGKFTDDSKTDCYIFQADGDKSRLKTNIDKHVEHVRESGLIPAIKLFKYWNVRNGLNLKTFVLELLVIEVLRFHKNKGIGQQFEHALSVLRDNIDRIKIEDPANPTGNDLSQAFDQGTRRHISAVAAASLSHIDDETWTALFGDVGDIGDKGVALASIVSSVGDKGSKPWCRQRHDRST